MIEVWNIYLGSVPRFFSKIHMDGQLQKLIDRICRELEMMKYDTHMTCQL